MGSEIRTNALRYSGTRPAAGGHWKTLPLRQELPSRERRISTTLACPVVQALAWVVLQVMYRARAMPEVTGGSPTIDTSRQQPRRRPA